MCVRQPKDRLKVGISVFWPKPKVMPKAGYYFRPKPKFTSKVIIHCQPKTKTESAYDLSLYPHLQLDRHLRQHQGGLQV